MNFTERSHDDPGGPSFSGFQTIGRRFGGLPDCSDQCRRERFSNLSWTIRHGFVDEIRFYGRNSLRFPFSLKAPPPMSTLTRSNAKTVPAARKSAMRTLAVPSLAQMIRDGRESDRKIKRASKEALQEWFKQSERLNIARVHYKLRGDRFLDFARRVGLDRTTAFDLVKLWKHRAAITSRCLDEAEAAAKRGETFSYPGWRTALGWFDKPTVTKAKPKTLADAIHYIQQVEAQKAELEERLSGPRHGKMGRARSQEKETPNWLYQRFDKEFHFTCDASASVKNYKHPNYFTKQQDALTQEWRGVIWLNPPWNEIEPFVKKAYESAQAGATVVCLVPLWSTEDWFLVYAVHAHIRILSDRVAFEGYDGKAPQPLSVVVFTKGSRRRTDGSLYVTVEHIEAPAKPRYKDKIAAVMSRGFAVF